MPRKAAEKTESKVKVSPKKETKKTTESKVEVSKVKQTKEPKETSSSTKFSSSLNNIKQKVNKKTGYTVLTIIGILILLVLAGKYLVVAWVDNKPITRFEYYSDLDKRYGKDLREELIVEKLLDSESSKRHITVSSQEIQDEIKKVETQQGGADKLDQVLQVQNISRDDFNKLIRLQLIKQKMFSNGVNITDDDVNKYIDQNKDSLTAQGEAIDDKTKASVKDQLTQQQVNTNFNNWLNDALKGSRVVRS